MHQAGDFTAEIAGVGFQAETLSLLPQVTLEDAGTIRFQVGSCSSEAELKVTGEQLLPMPGPLLGYVLVSLSKELLRVGGQKSKPSSSELALGWRFSNL